MNTAANNPVRVRYAPSPTGLPHVGNVRTALFNWLFARRSNGAFIVRVEDTDQNRLVRDAVDGILESLRWLDLDWDEGPEVGGPYGPYMQSERLPIYLEAAQDLIRRGHAFYCICSPERLQELRSQQTKERKNPGYDGRCLSLTDRELRAYRDAGNVPVVRFKMVRDDTITVDDIVRGRVGWNSNLVDDFVILKSDGFPTYHLANVLDDHHMKISHVLRAEEWLSSTPRHLALYRALGLEPPLFGHLPMILGPDRSKLSKRHGATSLAGIPGYGLSAGDAHKLHGAAGVVPGRSDRDSGPPGTGRSLFSRSGGQVRGHLQHRQAGMDERDLHQEPSVRRPGCAHPRILATLPPGRGSTRRGLGVLMPNRPTHSTPAEDSQTTLPSARRCSFSMRELAHKPKDLIQKGMTTESACSALEQSLVLMGGCDSFTADVLEPAFEELRLRLELSRRQFFSLLRVATTASRVSPPLFETMEVLGRSRCTDRIGGAILALGS